MAIKEIEIEPFMLTMKGISFSDNETVQTIMDVCHKNKHLYMEGFPCGRKTRKKIKKKFERWAECPGMCFTYLVTSKAENSVTIRVLVSSVEELLGRYTRREILYYVQMFLQGIADEVLALFGDEDQI